MYASRWVVVGSLAVLFFTDPALAQRFPGTSESTHDGFAVGLTGGYTFLAGEVGDSVSGGFRLQGQAVYDLPDLPLHFGVGAAYSWLGFDESDGTLGKLNLFALGTWKFVDLESSMVPYISARLGWTWLSDDEPCGAPACNRVIEGSRESDGFEIGTAIGVELPVSRTLIVDIGGSFDWLGVGDYRVDGVWSDDGSPAAGTIPDTSRSGSAFTIYAGILFYPWP